MRLAALRPAQAVVTALVLTLALYAAAALAQEPAPATPAAPTIWAPLPPISEEERQRILKSLLLTASGDPDSGPGPLKVKFTVEIYEDDAEKPKFEWNFGDSSKPSHEQNPTHTYKKVGKYLATVRATEAKGRSGSDEVMIYVEEKE